MNHKQINKVALVVILLVAFGLPLVIRSATYLHILVLLLFYAYLTTSWNLVGGFAGVLPLGHAAFVGIGAYYFDNPLSAIWNQSLDRHAGRWSACNSGRNFNRHAHL